MRRWTLTPVAAEDLLDIGRYTSGMWGESQSEAYLDILGAAFDRLARTPAIARQRDDLRPGLASYRQNHHVIFFRRTSRGIEILRVLHERRSAERAFPGGAGGETP